MVKLRLRRTGRKKCPSYQIVAIDSRKKRDGSYLEKIGYYYPLDEKSTVDTAKACKWLKVGAQPTDVVRSILRKHQIFAHLRKLMLNVANVNDRSSK